MTKQRQLALKDHLITYTVVTVFALLRTGGVTCLISKDM